jgi:DNA mismatch endonuclease Vsr
VSNKKGVGKREKYKSTRSYIMSRIKSKDTKIELAVRKALWKDGYRYRKNYSLLPGKPDLVFLKEKVAVFCDSDFWHGYDWENKKSEIKSHKDFWYKKIEKNIQRDKEVTSLLEKKGYIVIRCWGHEIKNNLSECIRIIEKAILYRRQKKCREGNTKP